MNNEEKILEMLADLKAGQNRLETRMDGMEKRMDGMEKCMDGMEKRMDGIETYSRQTRMLMEKQEHNIRLIAEQHTDIVEKLDRANDRAAQIEDVRERLRVLEDVVMNHAATIKELQELRMAE